MFDNATLNAATEPPSRGSFYRMSVFVGLGIFGVLAVFQPFGTYVFEHDFKYLFLAGYGLLVPLTALVLRESITLFHAGFFAPERWTFRRELLMTGLFLLSAIVLSYFYHHLAIGGRLSLRSFLVFVFFAMATAALPMALLLVKRYVEIKKELALAEISGKLPQTDNLVVLKGENKNEKLTLIAAEILYLRAADNYVEIFLHKKGPIQRHILRGALGSLLQQLETSGQFRQVHRSFVVNFAHPARLEGKSPAYFLVFEQAPDAEEIPVSRSSVAEVREILSAKPR